VAGFEWLRRAADLGDARAMTNLGLVYEKGVGTAVDMAQAVQCYTRGADAGQPVAMTNLGRLYESGIGVANAIQWFRRAAELAAG
jgi:TPR repeat protein